MIERLWYLGKSSLSLSMLSEKQWHGARTAFLNRVRVLHKFVT